VVYRRLDEEAVLVHMGTNQIYALNPTAARFWELYSDGLSLDEIEERLRNEFDVTVERLRSQIQELLLELTREDIVRPG
jgi:hypothetical protein